MNKRFALKKIDMKKTVDEAAKNYLKNLKEAKNEQHKKKMKKVITV